MQTMKIHSEMQRLRSLELEELLDKAWKVREKNFSPQLKVSAPSLKRYRQAYFSNEGNRFTSISVTGKDCSLRCDHCNAQLLNSMHPTLSEEEVLARGREVKARGGEGVLISGGADREGRVPLEGYYGAMKGLKEMGLKVIVHSGLVGKKEARGMKEAGVDQVLVDMIGDRDTIHRVYHLKKKPSQYLSTLVNLKDAGLVIAPHIVIGLDYGEIKGEYNALEMVSSVEPEVAVFVVLSPLPNTRMEGAGAPGPEEVARLIAMGRILNPQASVNLGCARPPQSKEAMEKLAVEAGVNAVAYPRDETLDFARAMGLKLEFSEMCCTLV